MVSRALARRSWCWLLKSLCKYTRWAFILFGSSNLLQTKIVVCCKLLCAGSTKKFQFKWFRRLVNLEEPAVSEKHIFGQVLKTKCLYAKYYVCQGETVDNKKCCRQMPAMDADLNALTNGLQSVGDFPSFQAIANIKIPYLLFWKCDQQNVRKSDFMIASNNNTKLF